MRQKRRCAAVLAVAAALLSAAGHAQPAITPEQALSFVRAGDLHFSPDGSKLAYIALSYRWDWKPHVRVLDVASGTERDLTPAGKAERSPQWSSDGAWLAFISNRGGSSQVYLMAASGGDATALTARKFGVTRFHWSPDGGSIAYLAKDDAAPPTDDGPQVADREADHERVWRMNVESKATRRFGLPGWRTDDFQWQDNDHLLLSASDQPRTQPRADGIYELSTESGAIRKLSAPPQPFDSLAVAPDGRSYAVRSTASKGPIERDLFTSPMEAGEPRPVAAPGGLGIEEIRWPDAKALWMRVADGMRSRLFRLAPGAAPAAVDLPLSAGSFDVSSRGAIAYVGEDFDHLQEIYLRERDGRTRVLTHLQSAWGGQPLASATTLHMKSFDGTPLEAVLMKPAAGASPSGRSPLVLLVHGGPASRFTAGYGWDTAWAQLLAAHGYQVLLVNPRGSLGYGEDFVEANRADWGGGDFKDLMTVLDAVIAKGEVDPQRLGIGGWSYGGEMTSWAIGQTQRFRAAVDGAGVYDQQAEFETESDPEEDEWYFGTPWEHPDVFARNSPATFIRNARTPTLILGGENDESNPVGQSIGLYRALKHMGVETEMVLYPGEGHSPRRGSYNIDMFTRILDWYDRHLKPAASPQPS